MDKNRKVPLPMNSSSFKNWEILNSEMYTVVSVYEVLPSLERKPETVLCSVVFIATPFQCGASHFLHFLLAIEVKQWWHTPLISTLG